MPELAAWTRPGPYHIIRHALLRLPAEFISGSQLTYSSSYGTLLGSEIFQSFIGGIVAFRCLPRPQFATLQSNLFPIYFAMQTALPAVMALTFPGASTALGRGTASISGVFAPENRWSVLLPLGTILLSGLANAAYIGPQTTSIMRERKHQETRDGKKSYDPPPHSDAMRRLNKRFGMIHGVSSLINLAALIATLAYSATISDLL